MTRPVAPSALIAAAAFALLLLPRIAGAQDAPAEGSDKERLKRAKEEQAEQDKQKEKTEADAKAAADAEAEKARLAKIGAPDAVPLPEEEGGFFVGLTGWATTVSGADRTVARVSDIVTTATTAEQLDLDAGPPPSNPGAGLADAFTVTNPRNLKLAYTSKAAPELELGFRRKGGGSYSVRYFAWSASSSQNAASSRRFASTDPTLGDLILGGIDNQGFENTLASQAANPAGFARPFGSPREIMENQVSGADSVSASGKLDVRRLDLMYSRTALARKRMEVTYRVGLSLVDAERRSDAEFAWHSFGRDLILLDASSIENVSESAKVSALGPMAGVAARWGLTASRRWSVRLGLDVGALKARRKTRFSDIQQFNQTGLPTPPLTVYQDVTDDKAKDLVTIIEGDGAVEYRFKQRFRVALGYRQARWFSALSEEKFPSSANTAQLRSDVLDLALGGPYVRIGVFF